MSMNKWKLANNRGFWMASLWMKLFLYLCITQSVAEECHGCKPAEIKKVYVTKHCNDSIYVETAVSLHTTNHAFNWLTPCLNCSLTLLAPTGHQLIATVYNMGLYNKDDPQCPLSKLDIFDGNFTNQGDFLTNETGLCGCDLPHKVYRSESPVLTFLLTTVCLNDQRHHRIFGQFDIVVSVFKPGNGSDPLCPGEFQCNNRYCVDKNDVCNERNDCGDNTDEMNCKPRDISRSWLIVLICLAAACALFLLIITILMCYNCCKRREGYTRI